MRRAQVVLVVVLAITSVRAQTPEQKAVAFEVAAIKLNLGDNPGGGGGMSPGGRFHVTNINVVQLIQMSNRGVSGVPLRGQVLDAPDWASSERYDIDAVVGDDLRNTAIQDLIKMTPRLLRSLLEDRFKLTMHHEIRQIPVYELVLAKKDGTLGPKLRRARVDCRTDPVNCMIQTGVGRFGGPAVGMPMLVQQLSYNVDRVIVDHTGLQGLFEVTLEWMPDRLPVPGGNGSLASDRPSLFTALQEQLGLKLDATRDPVDVVVIDHVEKPTPD